MIPSSGKTIASPFLRAELLRRGLTRRDVAEGTGYTVETVSNIICGNNRSRGERLKLEIFLNLPLWSSRDELDAQRKILSFYGALPLLLTLRELDALAAAHLPEANRKRPIRPREALVARLETFALSSIAANSEPATAPTP
jgi:transcriptional regulator with XRE-family HTH domain